MIKGAIFDLDGTLLDSMDMWENFAENYLRSQGVVPKEDLGESIKNLSLYDAVDCCKRKYNLPKTVKEIIDEFDKIFYNYYRNEVALKPGAKAFLKKLKENNVNMCIASATEEHLVKAALKRCGIEEYFSEVFTCTACGNGKENPAIYRMALKYLNTKKSDTIVFEDVYFAAKTAKDDGFLVAAVFDKQEKDSDKIKEIADCYIPDFYTLNDFWRVAESL